MNNKYTVIDLFAGAGGLSKAFQEAGAEIIWANEIDKHACDLYRDNFNDVYLVEGDIKNIQSEKIPDFDMLVGGFPCQSFSIAGRMNEYNAENENLFFEVIRILKVKKPRVFLLENVKGIMSHDNGRTFKIITEELKNLGYFVKSAVLNSMHYGNIPHDKERLYIVGFREEKECKMFEFPNEVKITRKIEDIIDVKYQKDSRYYLGKNIELIKKVKGETLKKDTIYQLRYRQSCEEKYIVKEYKFCPPVPLLNITIPLIVDNFGARNVTPLECFKFQGYFDIKIPTNFHNNRLYKYAAECSLITVVERIAKNIISVLGNHGCLRENNEICSGAGQSFNLSKNKFDEFPIGKTSIKLKIDKNNKTNSINQQMTIDKYIAKFEEDLHKLEEESVDAASLIKELSEIKPGKQHATIFHKYVIKSLNYIFAGYLLRQKVEVEVNEGRKRIDIMFDNLAERGFFSELNSLYRVFCPKIIIECKNYSLPLSNPEIDQLIGRFNNHIGEFGMLICRSIGNTKALLRTCKDALNSKQGYIIVLADTDIKELLIFRQNDDIEAIDNYLRDKFDELIL